MKTALLNFFSAVAARARAHKIIATIVALVVLWGGYHLYGSLTSTAGQTSYVVSTVATGTVIATLSESGQIAATSEVSVSAKAAGTVLAIYITPGTHVAAGTAIAKIDPTDALKALRDAELSLETAQLTYDENTAASTALELLQAKNAVTNAEVSLSKTRDSSYASVGSIYTDLGSIISGLDSVLHDSSMATRPNQENLDAFSDTVSSHDTIITSYRNAAATSYTAAVIAYNDALAVYKATSRSATNDELIALAQSTYTAAQAVADAVKDAHDFYDRVSNDFTVYNYGSSATLASLLSSTNTYTTTITSDLSSALSIKSNIISAEQSLAVAQDALQTAQEGPDELALKSAALTLKKAQEAVTTAQEDLADTVVRAPFSGTVASIAIDKYQTVGSGTNVATMVSDTKVASISVSEADAIQIKPGQKATLTFDALPDVTIAGTVISISTAGNVSSGVVSYAADISLDTANDAIKPGMSVIADIITGSETGLVVPASAIKASGNSNYVLVFDPALTDPAAETTGAVTSQVPQRVTVTLGLAGDTETIIASGLAAGEQVVTRSSTVSTTNTTTTQTSGSTRSNAGQLRALGPGL